MSSVSQTESCGDATPAVRRTGFSLGSNRGDRLAYLERACDKLAELFGDLRLSRVYETKPVGCPPGSPNFLNACVEVFTTEAPEEILEQIMRIERELGRTRNGEHGEPRTCDIDLLYCGEEQRQSERLTLPHPRIAQRRFVLRPLCDIDPELKLPGLDGTMADLLAQLPGEGKDVNLFNL